MSDTVRCPNCGEQLTQVGKFWVCPEHGQVSPDRPFEPLRIFLSYGHDGNEELVKLIRADLEARGHDVWFDRAEIRAGDDWRRSITEGIADSERFLSFLSKYSTRDPGVCLDEIAIAIGVKGGNIQTVLVESEREVRPPTSVSHIQWLDMHDWRQHHDAGGEDWEGWYRGKLAEIVAVVESDESRRFAGEIRDLERHLLPLSSDARMGELLRDPLAGRRWLFEALDQWRDDPDRTSRLFWIAGAPGVGKSKFAAHLAHYGRDEVIAVHFCEYDKPGQRDARRIVRTLAFQMATRLPDLRRLLLDLPEISKLDNKSPSELFDYLLAGPLSHVIDGGRQRYLVVIDALDEASRDGRNELVELLASHAPRLPEWIGIVVTSRLESDVVGPLQELRPFPFDTAAEANLADLRDYLRSELATQLDDHPDADGVVEQIVAKSEGIFLYVECFCEDAKQGHISLDHPDQFPDGLGGIYHSYFHRLCTGIQRFREHFRPPLRAVLAAREPLPLGVLRVLVGWQEEELRDLTRELGTLFPITVVDGVERIRPYHKAVADWLADETRAGVYFVSILEGHRMLAHELARLLDEPDPLGAFARRHLSLHLVLSEEWRAALDAMSDPDLLKALRWELPGDLMQAAVSVWPSPDLGPLTVIPRAFVECAMAVSPRACGFMYVHEDVIASMRLGTQVFSREGRELSPAEVEPDNGRMYAFIAACRRMLRCAFDYSAAVDARPRRWLARFLAGCADILDELETISDYYDRTHFGPSLRAAETVFMWESMMSDDPAREEHARTTY